MKIQEKIQKMIQWCRENKQRIYCVIIAVLLVFWTIGSALGVRSCARETLQNADNGMITAKAESVSVTPGLSYTLSDEGYAILTGRGSCTGENIAPGDMYQQNYVLEVYSSAFKNDTDLLGFYMPTHLTTIGSSAFNGCMSLTSVAPRGFNNSLQIIKSSAFYGCSSLSEFAFGPNLKIIYASAFNGCTSLTEIELPSVLEGVYANAFANSGVWRVKLKGTTIPTIYQNAFGTNVTEIEIPAGSYDSYIRQISKLSSTEQGFWEPYIDLLYDPEYEEGDSSEDSSSSSSSSSKEDSSSSSSSSSKEDSSSSSSSSSEDSSSSGSSGSDEPVNDTVSMFYLRGLQGLSYYCNPNGGDSIDSEYRDWNTLIGCPYLTFDSSTLTFTFLWESIGLGETYSFNLLEADKTVTLTVGHTSFGDRASTDIEENYIVLNGTTGFDLKVLTTINHAGDLTYLYDESYADRGFVPESVKYLYYRSTGSLISTVTLVNSAEEEMTVDFQLKFKSSILPNFSEPPLYLFFPMASTTLSGVDTTTNSRGVQEDLLVNGDSGYYIGYIRGQEDGYTSGYEAGRDSFRENYVTKDAYDRYGASQYNKGYLAGIENTNEYTFTGLLGAVIDVPVKTFMGLFNFEILGMNMASFFTSLLTICIILAVVKLIL